MTIQTPQQIAEELAAQLHATENRLARAEKLCDAAVRLEIARQMCLMGDIDEGMREAFRAASRANSLAVTEYLGGVE